MFNEVGECVGIAFQSLAGSDAENIGYVIPTPVIQHFLTDFRYSAQSATLNVILTSQSVLQCAVCVQSLIGMSPYHACLSPRGALLNARCRGPVRCVQA